MIRASCIFMIVRQLYTKAQRGQTPFIYIVSRLALQCKNIDFTRADIETGAYKVSRQKIPETFLIIRFACIRAGTFIYTKIPQKHYTIPTNFVVKILKEGRYMYMEAVQYYLTIKAWSRCFYCYCCYL